MATGLAVTAHGADIVQRDPGLLDRSNGEFEERRVHEKPKLDMTGPRFDSVEEIDELALRRI